MRIDPERPNEVREAKGRDFNRASGPSRRGTDDLLKLSSAAPKTVRKSGDPFAKDVLVLFRADLAGENRLTTKPSERLMWGMSY